MRRLMINPFFSAHSEVRGPTSKLEACRSVLIVDGCRSVYQKEHHQLPVEIMKNDDDEGVAWCWWWRWWCNQKLKHTNNVAKYLWLNKTCSYKNWLFAPSRGRSKRSLCRNTHWRSPKGPCPWQRKLHMNIYCIVLFCKNTNLAQNNQTMNIMTDGMSIDGPSTF